MSWSYDETLAADKDKVRFEIGDTDSTVPGLSNEEILAKLSSEGTVLAASLACARGLLSRYARKPSSWSNLSLQIAWNERLAELRRLVGDLSRRLGAVGGGAEFSAGGLTISGKTTLADDTDAVQPPHGWGYDSLTDPTRNRPPWKE